MSSSDRKPSKFSGTKPVDNLPTFFKEAKRARKAHKVNKDAGVIYLGNLPKEFEEEGIREYFTQFGDVTRMRYARNGKTGRPRGYCFLEFETAEIAEIVAKTMNGYRMFAKNMKASVIPAEKVHPDMWRRCFQKWQPYHVYNLVKSRKDHEKPTEKAAGAMDAKAYGKKVRKDKLRAQKLKALGVEYEFKGGLAQHEAKSQLLKAFHATQVALKKTKGADKQVTKEADDNMAKLIAEDAKEAASEKAPEKGAKESPAKVKKAGKAKVAKKVQKSKK